MPLPILLLVVILIVCFIFGYIFLMVETELGLDILEETEWFGNLKKPIKTFFLASSFIWMIVVELMIIFSFLLHLVKITWKLLIQFVIGIGLIFKAVFRRDITILFEEEEN